jgi:signal transduction histidine kinase
VRRIATELRPPILDDLGFGEAVSWHVAEFARRSGLKCTLDLQAQSHVADDVVATALFRIVQESLTNVVRHAEATSVHVKLVRAGKELVLSVIDDGAGFSPEGRAGKGIGLVSIRERAMSLGGRLDVGGAPGAGTTITVSLPLARPLAQRSNA